MFSIVRCSHCGLPWAGKGAACAPGPGELLLPSLREFGDHGAPLVWHSSCEQRKELCVSTEPWESPAGSQGAALPWEHLLTCTLQINL